MSARARLTRFAVVALALVALTSCGKRGNPVAPQVRVPQPVGDLVITVVENSIELTWTVPRRRMDGSRLPDPAVARLYRTEDSGHGEPKPALMADGRIAGYTPIVTLQLQPPVSEGVQRGRVIYRDRAGLVYGQRYTYVVLTADDMGRSSPPSPRVSVRLVAAPEPPSAPGAQPGERQARVSWAPPGHFLDGSPASGPLVYELLRATEPGGPAVVVARTAPGQTSVVDGDLENDRTYYYAVRAVRIEAGSDAIGAPSSRVAVTPTDMTPPAPPSELVAIPLPGEVRLSWRPSPTSDVGAYVVYRSDGASLVRIGSVRAPATTFTDRDVAPGTYRYAVAAQDTGARANESVRSAEVTVAVP